LLLVVAIIGILASLILPAVGLVRKQAQRATCGSNMQQIYTLMVAYGQDNRSVYPAGQWLTSSNQYISWDDQLASYDGRDIPMGNGTGNDLANCHLSLAGTDPKTVKSYRMYTCPTEDYITSQGDEWTRSYAYASGNFTSSSESPAVPGAMRQTTDVSTTPNCWPINRRIGLSYSTAPQTWNKRGAYFAVTPPPGGNYPGANVTNAGDWAARISQVSAKTILMGEIRHDRGCLGGPWGVVVDFPGTRSNCTGGPDGVLNYGSSGSITIVDSQPVRTPSQLMPLHGMKWNYLFGDGRVAAMTETETYPTVVSSVLNNMWIR